ncbi:SRPBCC family protein [Hyphomicrobium sp.]|uniref:SRPBCC family protein n=1 Tax=Hyphomicrobium sp. TaxID=82 RepID=UPI0025C388FB|nr:SRPBCC family protein [Hyphomicrobium sp.]MCC7253932.1 SRPBCC family protein [Hyphomicrobium sp.]
MLKRILLAVVAVVLAFVVYVALQPSAFRIERSTIVVAPPEAVFAEVNDFHNWQAWSPWAKLDPDAKATFEGPDSGEGAVFRWAGNAAVGEGSMTLLESKPHERIRIRIDFLKPWSGTNTTEFTFKPDGPRTVVTWAMSGEQDFIQKAICVFMNPDKMVGGEFEKGLASMKATAESKLGDSQPVPN